MNQEINKLRTKNLIIEVENKHLINPLMDI